jgi:protein O-GlcNAc transferase
MKFKYRQRVFSLQGVSPEEHIYKAMIQRRNFYEIDLLEYMYAISRGRKDSTVAIDVGANIGNHSVYFGTFLADHLIAIEPNPDVLPFLKKNLSDMVNTSIYECALGEIDGMGKIVLAENAMFNLGGASIDIEGDNNTVPITTLDAIVAKWQTDKRIDAKISIIKVDVEGMEIAVLKGARNTLRTYKPQLFVEASTREKAFVIHEHLKDFGYVPLSKWGATPLFHFEYSPSVYQIVLMKLKAISIKMKRKLINKIIAK